MVFVDLDCYNSQNEFLYSYQSRERWLEDHIFVLQLNDQTDHIAGHFHLWKSFLSLSSLSSSVEHDLVGEFEQKHIILVKALLSRISSWTEPILGLCSQTVTTAVSSTHMTPRESRFPSAVPIWFSRGQGNLYGEHLVEYGPSHASEAFLMKAKDLVVCTPPKFNIDTQTIHTWSRRYIFQTIIFGMLIVEVKMWCFCGAFSTRLCTQAPVPSAKVTRTKTSKMMLHLLGFSPQRHPPTTKGHGYTNGSTQTNHPPPILLGGGTSSRLVGLVVYIYLV